MHTYRVILTDGQHFWIRCNMLNAAASIVACFHEPSLDDNWQPTPYQTADARHDLVRAAGLVAEYYAVDADDCVTVKSVRVAS